MTLPTTHPLYGAVETLAIALCELDGNLREWVLPWPDLLEVEREKWREIAAGYICILEAAGYRVVGPEPTEAMMEGAEWFLPVHGLGALREVIGNAIDKAPTITETEKGK